MGDDTQVSVDIVQAERLEVSRILRLSPHERQRIADVVYDTEKELVEVLKQSGRDLERIEIRWTCSVVGLTEPKEV